MTFNQVLKRAKRSYTSFLAMRPAPMNFWTPQKTATSWCLNVIMYIKFGDVCFSPF